MIAVDAMGGDHAPREAVKGALAAAEDGVPLVLFGKKDVLVSLLSEHNSQWHTLPIKVVHCSEVIDMGDNPIKSIMRKKDSSLMRGMHAVQEGEAHAFVSAGNSGAVVAAATIIVGRVEGVLRPAIGSFLPTNTGSSLFCLDLGANPDCKPEYLVQFAYMGMAYVRLKKHIAQPRIALLSNGHESCKGSQLVRSTYELLEKEQIHFVGNIESRDIFSDKTDVVITDGFTGNVLLKGIQGTANSVLEWMKEEARRSLWSRIMLACSWPILSRIKKRIDYARTGGALLLGVKNPVIIAHGSSKAIAIKQAIMLAHSTVQNKILPTFNESLKKIIAQSSLPIALQKQKSSVSQSYL